MTGISFGPFAAHAALHSRPSLRRLRNLATHRDSLDTHGKKEREWSADLALARRALAHDEGAVRELSRRLAVVPAFLRSRNEKLGEPFAADELDDLVQDVLVIAWRRMDSFAGRSRLETWVCSIGTYEMMNALRRRERRQRREQELGEHSAAAAEPREIPEASPEELQGVLSGLSVEEAGLLRLRHQEGLPFPEIAERLGLSESGAKNRYYRLLDRLRQRLSGREEVGA